MKILLSKPGLDGHDVGVKVLAHALREAGFDIFYTGLRKSIEEIVNQAREVNADMIGLSILSGTHVIICQRMQEVLDEEGVTIPWLVGGNIPLEDLEMMEGCGATAIFPTGTKIDEVVTFLKEYQTV
ncbi:MAG: cobalamin-dependent protein [Candidatus Marinimicrobia bacterium]|jgi:methylmalonyl-CoA mutase C-terminal domain/subunit|nr:methylmalonyl-CoA mutase [Nitrospinota bacterium]MDP6396907.1 cobalamin-dependent protein [Candidatus Neomarinimicrobiota bacterium]MDP7007206.1 cobalamin-dependent protein [Candidatus Poseidoniia archaeon]|tara:strand:+ start:906 stop:1286 length:381 start_codon:yes stop_codon:yes gene_type:complete